MEIPTETTECEYTKANTLVPNAQNESEFGSDDLQQPFCDPCSNEGTELPAEGYCETCGDYLCNQCFNIHCKPKPLRHHILLDSQNMPGRRVIIENSDDFQAKCHKHENMPLKIYCRTHDDTGCILCLTTYHTTCGDVSFIQDVVKEFSKSKEYLDFQQELNALEGNLNSQVDAAKSEAHSITEMHSALQGSGIFKDITMLLEEARNIDVKMTEANKSASQMVNDVEAACKNSISELQQFLATSKSDILKFFNMKKGHTIACEMNTCLDNLKTDIKRSNEEMKASFKLSKKKMTEYNIQIQKSLSKLWGSDACSATQEPEKKEKETKKEVFTCTDINVVSLHNCNCSVMRDDSDVSNEENYNCRITGSTVLSDGRIAVVDFDNKMLKIHSSRNNCIEATYDFDSNPFDVAEIYEDSLVVTLPSARNILQISVDEDDMYNSELSYYKTMNTNGSCYGICTHQRILYVAFDKPPKVGILDMDGYILLSVDVYISGENIFSSPWYVAFNPVNGRLYVTDRNRDTITCLTTDGRVESICNGWYLKRPYGITVDRSGTVYVCSRNTDKIVCLSPALALIAEIEEGNYLHKPESVACWTQRDRLYVGLYQNDYITVLDILKS